MSLKGRRRTGNVTNWARVTVSGEPRPSLHDNAAFFSISFFVLFPRCWLGHWCYGAKRFSSINVGVVFHSFIYGEIYFIRLFVLCFSPARVGGSAVRYVFPLFRGDAVQHFLPLVRCVSPRPYKKERTPFSILLFMSMDRQWVISEL